MYWRVCAILYTECADIGSMLDRSEQHVLRACLLATLTNIDYKLYLTLKASLSSIVIVSALAITGIMFTTSWSFFMQLKRGKRVLASRRDKQISSLFQFVIIHLIKYLIISKLIDYLGINSYDLLVDEWEDNMLNCSKKKFVVLCF